MGVPQEDIVIGFHPPYMRQYTRPLAKVLIDLFIDRQDACPTRKNPFCGTGILPVLFIFARGLRNMQLINHWFGVGSLI